MSLKKIKLNALDAVTFFQFSFWDLNPVDVATQTFFRVATQKKFPTANQIRSRPELNDRIEIFWVATRSKILDCFHRAVYHGKFSEKFLGRDPKNFLVRDRFLDFWFLDFCWAFAIIFKS
jgi:hypothetical protein